MDIFPNDFTGLVVAGFDTDFLSLKKVVFGYSSAAETELIVDFVELFERVSSFQWSGERNVILDDFLLAFKLLLLQLSVQLIDLFFQFLDLFLVVRWGVVLFLKFQFLNLNFHLIDLFRELNSLWIILYWSHLCDHAELIEKVVNLMVWDICWKLFQFQRVVIRHLESFINFISEFFALFRPVKIENHHQKATHQIRSTTDQLRYFCATDLLRSALTRLVTVKVRYRQSPHKNIQRWHWVSVSVPLKVIVDHGQQTDQSKYQQ